jgi:hypothetical protein
MASDAKLSVWFAGKTAAPQPSDVSAHYEKLAASAGSCIPQIYALHDMRYDAPTDSVRGEVLIMSRDTPAARIANRFHELGGRISAVRLPDDAISSRSKAMTALQRNVDILLDDPSEQHDVFSIKDGNTRAYKPSMEGDSHFVGAYQVKSSSASGDGGGSDFGKNYLVAHTSASSQSDELRDYVADKGDELSVGALLESDEFKRLMTYAQVNNRTQLARVAAVFDAEQHISCSPDTSEFVTGPRHRARDLATPDYCTAYGTLRLSSDDPSQVLFFNRVIDTGSSSGDGILLPLGPLNGVRLYRFKDNLPSGKRAAYVLRNQYQGGIALGMPFRGGDAAPTISVQLREDVDSVMHWPNKGASSDIDAEVYASAVRRQYSKELLRTYDRVYFNGGRALDDGSFAFEPRTLKPLAVFVKPSLQCRQQ